MFFHRYKKIFILVPGLVLLLSIAVLSYGYLRRIPDIYGRFNKDYITREDTNQSLDEGSQTPSPYVIEASKTENDAKIILERHYTKCGHTYTEEQFMEKRFIGKTRSEIAQAFPDWQLKDFSPERVLLSTKINSYCPDHYIIREEDGFLVIFRADKDTGYMIAVEATNIPIDRLSQELQEQVSKGMVLDSIEAVEQLMEDWES